MNEITTTRVSSLDLKPGRRLGKYRLAKSLGEGRLAKSLGEGGSCEVWKARDTVEGIWVALKIPLADMHGKRDNQALLREVRLVARLRHPHIMPVKNADIIGGHAVLATELSVGTLADCSKPMSVRRIISIAAQVLDGLIYAHQKRMIHCDVTPGNIFLFPNGRAALGDFGIGLQVKGRMRTVDDFGTPGYVAPEQAYGRPTHRSDCFAVGLILYEYVTGFLPKWPFRWPPRGCQRLRGKTSLAFVRFLKHALAVDPDKRFADAEKMRAALLQAVPKKLKLTAALKSSGRKMPDWQKMRRAAFVKRYRAVVPALLRCADCGEPIAESMLICPRDATEACCPSGDFAHGVSARDSPRPLRPAPPARDTTAGAGTAKANSCASCVIVRGAAGRSAGPGTSGPSRKCVAIAAGRWIHPSGITVPGANRGSSESI
jgi:serine/threonine-protein kinase